MRIYIRAPSRAASIIQAAAATATITPYRRLSQSAGAARRNTCADSAQRVPSYRHTKDTGATTTIAATARGLYIK